MWKREPDGSVVAADGKVIYFSCERFIRDICLGNCCFICGASPDDKRFNDEHVVPNWLLANFDLHSRNISLPNGATTKYGRYKVPCCEQCNSLMGRSIENKISPVLAGGIETVKAYISAVGPWPFYIWMGLIFLKIHLKDRTFTFHLDIRKGAEKISDLYAWEELHHLHCVVRSFYTGAVVEPEAVGSSLMFSVRRDTSRDSFDLVDLTMAQAMLLRFNNVAFVTVFNDSCGALQAAQPLLDRITDDVSEVQLREIVTELAFCNLHLKYRPTYHSEIDLEKETHFIRAKIPALFDLNELDFSVRGSLLERTLQETIPHMSVHGLTSQQLLEAIRAGRFSLLFDNDGKFIEKNLIRPMS